MWKGKDPEAEVERMRTVVDFDEDWTFHQGEAPGAEAEAYDDAGWRRVRLPHDWSIEEPFDAKHRPSNGFLPQGVGWYRKTFELGDGAPGERVFLRFDGAYMDSRVWVNGREAGAHMYGYSGFVLDVTPHVREGRNVVAVRTDSTASRCRWYSGSGITRRVRLERTSAFRLEADSLTVRPRPEAPGQTSVPVRVSNRIVNEEAAAKTFALRTRIYRAGENEALAEVVAEGVLEARGTADIEQTLTLEDAAWWSPATPQLYEARTTLETEGREADRVGSSFGIRTVRFDSEKGLLLNGTVTKLKGVCLHHDAGCLGAAVPERSYERRLSILREMGCNAIRASHNPPAPEFLDLCDRMGFLVVDEFYDSWKFTHTGGDDALPGWDDWWEADLRASVRRDRNRPCVILWSVGNELPNQGNDEMIDWMKRLIAVVREEDPTRPVTCALAPRSFPDVRQKIEHVLKLAPYLDVVSLNYQEQLYELLREADPRMVILGSESFLYYRNKTVSNPGPSYEARNPWFDVEKHDYVTGQFIWAGIDYLGEALFWTDTFGWPNKGWSGSLVDACGFRRPISYFHESVWSDRPMVHAAVFDDAHPAVMRPHQWSAPKLASHWTLPHRENEMVKLVTFTNCETVELIANGASCGVQRLADWPDRTMLWHIPYKAGKVEAIGRIDGRVVATHEIRTAGEPARLRLSADRVVLPAGRRDVAHLEVSVVDEDGTIAPAATPRVTFRVEGEGRLIGVDNGNLLSEEGYKGDTRSAFLGRCLAVVETTGRAGRVTIVAEADGLESAAATVEVE
jgi:beta-galactosidase